MSDGFDPYHKWLAIPPNEQPANHYRLLATALYESDPDVIEGAADQRMAHLRGFQTGRNAAHVQRLLNEISAAKVCLLDPADREAYDRQLREQLTRDEANSNPAPSNRPSQPAVVIDAPARSVASKVQARQESGSKTLLIVGGLAGTVVVVLLLIFLLPGGEESATPRQTAATTRPVPKTPQAVTPTHPTPRPATPPRTSPTIPRPAVTPPAATPSPTPTLPVPTPTTPPRPDPVVAPPVQPTLPPVDETPKVASSQPITPPTPAPRAETAAKAAAVRALLVRICDAKGYVYVKTPAGTKIIRRSQELPQEILSVTGVYLSGEMNGDKGLAELGLIDGLTLISCTSGAVTDVGLTHLTDHPTLTNLNLSGCKAITAEGLEVLSQLDKIERFFLGYDDQITDAWLVRLRPLKNLRGLFLQGLPQITGTGLAELKESQEIDTLRLDGSSVKDDSLQFLAQFPKLRYLRLTRNPITDKGLIYLEKLPQLQILDLSYTQVTEAGVAKLRQALPDCNITSNK